MKVIASDRQVSEQNLGDFQPPLTVQPFGQQAFKKIVFKQPGLVVLLHVTPYKRQQHAPISGRSSYSISHIIAYNNVPF